MKKANTSSDRWLHMAGEFGMAKGTLQCLHSVVDGVRRGTDRNAIFRQKTGVR